MLPPASVSGMYLSHPRVKYFNVGRIGRDQLEDYAARQNRALDQAEQPLGAAVTAS